MAFHDKRDMSYSDDEILDKIMGPEVDVPEYPPGLCFSISEDDLESVGAEDGEPGDSMHFAMMAEVTSIFKGKDGYSRIELEGRMLAGEDGDFIELTQPAHLCLCGPELEKLELESDCERGDLIHLIGTARMESSSSTEWGGEQCTLQITDLTYAEDESEESR